MVANDTEKYRMVFIESFDLGTDELTGDKDLEYNTIDQWDSVGHMTMVANLEDTFEISMETDDIIDFSSFNKGKEILRKYGVSL